MRPLRSSMSALWNSLMKSAHVVCSVLMSTMPFSTGNCWTASRMSLVMSETSVRSSVASVKLVLKTFMSVHSLRGAHGIRQRESRRASAEANRYDKCTVAGLSNKDASGGLRVQEVAQPVAQQIEAQDGQGDGAAGEDREPWVQGQEILGLLEHQPPGRVRGLRA